MERMRYFVLKGKVQGVMCRQTLMRGAQKRDLDAGATNEANGEVTLTLSGDNDKIEEIIEFLRSGEPMNDWGAKIISCQELERGKTLEQHQVNTKNVDNFRWKQNCTMYL